MNLDRFKAQHVQILGGIDALRKLTHEGVEENAVHIATRLQQLSDVIIRHLAVEDRILYPAVQQSGSAQLAQMGEAYQEEMKGIANAYIAFSRRWSKASALQADSEGFRAEANVVLKQVYLRMQKENREFYPAIEAMPDTKTSPLNAS